MKIRKGDTVKVLYGKDAGKTGKIVKVFTKKDMVVVEGVNLFKRHLKGDRQNRQSEIVDLVKPMPVAKVQLVDPTDQKATRVTYKIDGDTKVRVGKKSGKEVDVQSEAKSEKAVKTESKKKVVKKSDK